MQKTTGHILIVDDERNIRKNLKLLFELEGYQVDAAENGEEALAKCEEGPDYDIIFSDLQMPKMGGFELLENLRRFYPGTVVVMVSAFGTVSRAVEAIKLGAVDFIEKPFDPDKIKLLVEEILFRKNIKSDTSVEELLKLAELARKRGSVSESRSYLKAALQRDLRRPEPYYYLAQLEETENRPRTAMQLYYMALESEATFEPAREALRKLGYLEQKENV